MEGADVDLAERHPGLARHGRSHPGREALVLDIGLHAGHGHGVAVGADPQTPDQNPLHALRQQAAVRNVDAKTALARVLYLQIRIDGVAVRVEIAEGDLDGVRVGTFEDLVEQGDGELTHDPPPLAGVDELSLIEGVLVLVLGVDEHVPHVDHVGLVDDGEVGIGVGGAELSAGQAGSLHAEFGVVGVVGRCPGGHGDVGVAGGVDDHLGQDDAASLGRGHHRALDASVLDERPAADGAEPDLGARLQQSASPPFHPLLDDPGGAAGHGSGEADPIPPIVLRDGPHRAHPAQAVQVLDHQRLGPLPGSADAGRCTAGAAADHHHVVLAEHGQCPGILGDRGQLLDRADADQEFTHVAGAQRLGRRLTRYPCPGRHRPRGGAPCRCCPDPCARLD